MPLTERQWRRLLTEIDDRQVLPIIGPEVVSIGVDGRQIPLDRHLSMMLAQRLDLKGLALDATVDDVVSSYLQQPDADRDEVYFTARQILGESQWQPPEALRQLAAIAGFDVFVSTTVDLLLESALDAVRFNGDRRTKSLAYTRFSEPVDLPPQYKSAYSPTERPPLEPAVYHIFGKVNPARDYAIWEEDFLYFGHRLQSRDFRPQNLFDLMRARTLLLLGCGFPGWLTRFFLAAAKGETLLTDGVRGVLADSRSGADPSLILFLERRHTSLYVEGAEAFIADLHRRWIDAHPPAASAPVAPPGPAPDAPPEIVTDAIFISYASLDRESAIVIRDALQTAGLDVWFDQRNLNPGDAFQDKILSNIERCSCFLPVISQSTAIPGRHFFFLEWNKAAEEVKLRAPGVPFIVPVVIDDTPYDAPHVPPPFRERHWQRLEGTRLPEQFVDLLRTRIRELRRGRRA